MVGRSTTRIWSAPTPKRRSPSRRHWSGPKSICWLIASMTTKSLPAPCILVNLSFMLFRLVERRLAGRARLEAFMGPQIFGWRLAHALLDEGVHAAGRVDHVLA